MQNIMERYQTFRQVVDDITLMNNRMHYKELADRVNYFKTSKEGEIDMTDIIEAYANNKAKEVAEKASKKMLADGMSLEAVVRYSDLSEEEVRALAAKQSA